MIPNEVWSGVCLYRLFSTTSGTSPRRSSITMRMPRRSDSSRRSDDSLDHLLAHEVGDLLEQPGLVDLVRDLGDDDRDPLSLLPGILDLGARPHGDRAAAGEVGLDDAGSSDDEPAGREVRDPGSG